MTRTILPALSAFLAVVLRRPTPVPEHFPEPEDAGFAFPPGFFLLIGFGAAVCALTLTIVVFIAFKLEREAFQRR